MKEGYKVTEIGDIPENWECLKIRDLGKVKRGASPRPIKDPKWWGGKVGWVRISDVTSSNKYLNKTAQYLSEAGVSNSIKVPKGELILTICATIGVPVIMNMEACIHDGFVWFDNLNVKVHREYLYYFLLSKKDELSSHRQTGTQGNLNTDIVGRLSFPLPPLPEQQKIAYILSTVDEKIENIDAQISQTRELKKSLLQQLLTKGIGHSKFKSSELGEIPESWEVKELTEISVHQSLFLSLPVPIRCSLPDAGLFLQLLRSYQYSG